MTTEQILAQQEARIATLILMRSEKRLPYPAYRVHDEETIALEFGALSDLEIWVQALTELGLTARALRRSESDFPPYWFQSLDGWPGCTVRLRAHELPAGPSAPLDAEMVAGLEAVAGEEPRCPSCGEPERLLASGAVGHCGDECGSDYYPECTHQAGCPRHGDVRDCDPMPAEQMAIHAGPYDVPAGVA